ncbi:hypothetical protein AB0B30_32500 [Streptomyces narbonensis]|uniref:Trimeric autotransporter adhesin YadA-like stalk domain-containing protein n=1 Tax=Streptomyces narbonensis TaxID=67333 RepID=A0ABV3CKT6_9ACTN
MPGVQFGQQIDMNGFKVTEMAPGVAGTDAVNVSQLNANAPQGFAQDVGDGVATAYVVTHNFNTDDVITVIFDKATKQDVMVEVLRSSVNAVTVTFGTPPALNAYRVLVIPVP